MITITFQAKPIESAPKDRKIMLWCPKRGWRAGMWEDQPFHKQSNPYWTTWAYGKWQDRGDQPTYWAEIDDMAVKS